ncbi:MAG: hypothetical protein ACOYOK_13530 [Pseudobdellovibrionaceae bacterium]
MKLIFVLMTFFYNAFAFAQQFETVKTPQPKSSQVLDFEGEVIEGERKKADLFLQISAEQIKFDSVLFLRENFNDYLEVDRKSRNKFFKTKK